MPFPIHTTATEQTRSQGTTDDAETLVLIHKKKQNLPIYVPATSTSRKYMLFKHYKNLYRFIVPEKC